MKRLLAMGLSTVLALPILSTTLAFAEDNAKTTPKTVTTTAATVPAPTATAETEKPPTAEDAKALAERIQKRKTELKTKLTNAEKLRLQGKCKAAQGLVSSVSGRIKGLETSRGEVYKNIVGHLNDLSTKLKNKGVNTDTLNADIATLQSKIDTFNTDLATYKQDANDLAGMDCKTDPDGFKASLEAARTAQQKTSQDAQAIRGYVNDTIKPLLKTIRAELEAKPTTSTTGGSH